MNLKKAEVNYMQKQLQNEIIVTSNFKDVFDKIILSIGIRETLELNDFDRIFTFLQRNFKPISLNDIKDAFDMYSAQQLEFKDGHFNSFDNVFIGKILKSYQQKLIDNKRKTKTFEPTDKIESTVYSRKEAFEIIRDKIFLDSSKRNGDRGAFPDLILANWKDAYFHLVETNQLKEMTGRELVDRLKECDTIMKAQEKNPKKKLSNSFNPQLVGESVKTSMFFKLEVVDWFILNREKLMF